MSTGGKERVQDLGRPPKESLIIINIGNKQEELELYVRSESHDTTGKTET